VKTPHKRKDLFVLTVYYRQNILLLAAHSPPSLRYGRKKKKKNQYDQRIVFTGRRSMTTTALNKIIINIL